MVHAPKKVINEERLTEVSKRVLGFGATSEMLLPFEANLLLETDQELFYE